MLYAQFISVANDGSNKLGKSRTSGARFAEAICETNGFSFSINFIKNTS